MYAISLGTDLGYLVESMLTYPAKHWTQVTMSVIDVDLFGRTSTFLRPLASSSSLWSHISSFSSRISTNESSGIFLTTFSEAPPSRSHLLVALESMCPWKPLLLQPTPLGLVPRAATRWHLEVAARPWPLHLYKQ